MPGERILIVEDEEIVAQMIRDAIAFYGYQMVGIVDSGERAIQAAEELRPDLLLMDVHLRGEMDGIETATRIRERLGTPAVYLTAHADQETVLRATVSDPFGYLLKPFDARDLYTTIEMALFKVRLEKRLSDSERRFRSLIEGSHDIVSVLDADGVIHFESASLEQVLGYGPDERIGQSAFEGVHPDDLPGVREAFSRVLREPQERQRFEFRCRHRDGSWRVLEAWGTNRLEDSAVAGVVVNSRDVTAQREVTLALRRSEEYHRLITRTTPDAIVTVDDADNVLFVNPAAEEMFGHSAEEMLRSPFSTLLPERHRESYRKALGSYVATGEKTFDWKNVKMTGLHRSGRELALEVSFGEFLAEGRRFFTGFLRDVGERRKTEAALRASEERLRELAESVREVLWSWDVEAAQWVYVSPAYEAIWGRSLEGLRQDPHVWFEAILADDRERAGAEFARAVQGEYDTEFRIVRPDGEVRWVWAHGNPVRDDAGEVYRITGVVEDITERKRAEAALGRRHELLRLALSAAVLANEAETSEAALGAVLSEISAHTGWAIGHVLLAADDEENVLVPSSIWVMRDPERMAPFREATGKLRFPPGFGLPGRVLERGKPEWVTGLDADPNFPRGPVARSLGLRSAFAVPILAGPRVLGVIELYTDESILPDEILLETLATIGTQLGRVLERKSSAEAVRRAREEAESANRAKSEFLSRMSHELRTPLNAILGFGQLLELSELPKQDRESVEQIRRAGNHLLALINEVLDLARIESRRLALSVQPVQLRSVLTEVLDLVRPLAAAQQVTVHSAEALACETSVWADVQRLRQVVLNLLSNAIKYNRAEGSVVLVCPPTAAGMFRFEIRDTGVGIDPEKFEHLFRPFDRLGAETSGIEGTGLGLSITKALVEAMGGDIGVESIPGEGSTFWIELPSAESSPLHAERESPADARTLSAFRPGEGNYTILYVEDDPSNLTLVERVLARYPGVTLLVAMQGGVGVDLARRHRPSLILLDLSLPDMPGEEVLRMLRQDPRSREIPVVVLSADATPDRIDALLAAGARAYVTKPLDVSHLLSMISEILHPRAA